MNTHPLILQKYLHQAQIYVVAPDLQVLFSLFVPVHTPTLFTFVSVDFGFSFLFNARHPPIPFKKRDFPVYRILNMVPADHERQGISIHIYTILNYQCR